MILWTWHCGSHWLWALIYLISSLSSSSVCHHPSPFSISEHVEQVILHISRLEQFCWLKNQCSSKKRRNREESTPKRSRMTVHQNQMWTHHHQALVVSLMSQYSWMIRKNGQKKLMRHCEHTSWHWIVKLHLVTSTLIIHLTNTTQIGFQCQPLQTPAMMYVTTVWHIPKCIQMPPPNLNLQHQILHPLSVLHPVSTPHHQNPLTPTKNTQWRRPPAVKFIKVNISRWSVLHL